MVCLDACEKLSDDAYSLTVRAARSVAHIVETTLCRCLLSKKRPRSALMVGLDSAGKSSILCSVPEVRGRLQKFARRHNRDDLRVEPTTALQLVKFTMTRSSQHGCHRRANISWHVWDMSGQGQYRPLWMYYCSLVQAIVFVVDVTDVERIAVARNELRNLFVHPAMRGLPLLVMANKIDAADSNADENVDEQPASSDRHLTVSFDMLGGLLGLDSLQREHRVNVKVVECSARTGMGIESAFQWLTDHVAW